MREAVLLRRIDWRAALLAAIVLYTVTTGWGVLNDGFHSDDWRHLNGTSPLWTAVEGRWLLEVIFRDLFGQRFLLPVQLALAFPCFWWVARVLARHAAPEPAQPAAALAIFAVAINHIYMGDALSFESNVFAYPFALALSVGAFELLWRVAGRPARTRALAVLGAAQLLAFSMAIYQTFAVAGLIVPVLALLRIDSVRFGAAVRIALIGAAASVVAIALYLAEWRTYAALHGVVIVSERFSGTDAAGFTQKLTDQLAPAKQAFGRLMKSFVPSNCWPSAICPATVAFPFCVPFLAFAVESSWVAPVPSSVTASSRCHTPVKLASQTLAGLSVGEETLPFP